MKTVIEIKDILQAFVGDADMKVFATRWLSIISGINATGAMVENYPDMDICVGDEIMHPIAEYVVDGHTITIVEQWAYNYDNHGNRMDSSGRYLQHITIDTTMLTIDNELWRAMLGSQSSCSTIHHDRLIEELNELMFDYFIDGGNP